MKLTLEDLDRLPVYGEKKRNGTRKRVGKVVDVVFDAEKPVAVGYVVARKDILFIWRRKDLLLAFDSARVRDGKIEVDGAKAWGPAAAKRLGIDWATVVIWRGMPVKSVSGASMGYVRDAVIDEDDGRLNGLGLTSGVAADVLVGNADMPAKMVRGWNGKAIIVEDAAREIEVDGGAAAAAGRATAIAQDAAGKAASKAVDAAGESAKVVVEGAKTAAKYTKSAAKVAAQTETGKAALDFWGGIGKKIIDAAGSPDDDK
jgi:sporulation protein YlmC with PRC-barrel domain